MMKSLRIGNLVHETRNIKKSIKTNISYNLTAKKHFRLSFKRKFHHNY